MKNKWLSALVAASLGLSGGAAVAWADEKQPDNTGVNVRDKSGDTVTPTDQGTSSKDVNITQSIRKAVASDDALSVDAQNVKIVTMNGVVTLRGPVRSVGEKASIEAKAKGVAGVTRVDNQLEIASQ